MDHVDDKDDKFIIGLLRVPSFMFAISSGRLLHLFEVVDTKIALDNDLDFLRTFILSLGSLRNCHEDLHLLYPNLSTAQIEDFRNLRERLEESICEAFRSWDPDCNGVSTMLDNIMVWKKQVTEIYPVLLNLKSESVNYVSRSFLNCFTTSTILNGEKILAAMSDLDEIEKKVIKAVVCRLKFLKILVHWVEIESMRSIFTLIHQYVSKTAYVLFLCWTGEFPANGRYEFLYGLQHTCVIGDQLHSTEVILDVLRVSEKMLTGEGIVVGCIDHKRNVTLKPTNLIWEYAAEWITLLDDHHNFQLSDCSSRLIVHLNSLHECLRFSSAYLDNLLLDMKVMIVHAVACLGLADVFQLGDLSKEVDQNFDASVLVTFLTLLKAELALMQLMKGNSCLIIVMTDRLEELDNNLRFLRKCIIALNVTEGCVERYILLLSHCEAVASGVLAFCQLHDEHKMEDELSTEMDLSILKLFGTTNLILLEIYVLFWLKNRNVLTAQVKYQFENMYDKLKFMLENLVEFAEKSKHFLLDTVLVASQLAHSLAELTLDEADEMTEQMLIEGNPSFLKLTATFELLVAWLILNTFLTTGQVDSVGPIDKIRKLSNGVRLLRIISLDSIEPCEEDDKLLCSQGEVLARIAVPVVCNLFGNKSDEGMAMERNHLISDLIEKCNGLETEVRAYYLNIWKSSQPTLPRIDGLNFLSFLVKKLSRLLIRMPVFSSIKYQFQRIVDDLLFTTSLLKNLSREYIADNKLNNLVLSLTDVGYEVENVAELSYIGGSSTKYILCIYVLVDVINQMRIRITDILANSSNHKKAFRKTLLQVDTPLTFIKERNDIPLTNKVFVGMAVEVEKIINDLTRGTKKRVIISIVGMGGLGKTTLAHRVYNDPLVRLSFNVCAWCCISKVFHKRALLIDILGFLTEVTDEIKKLTDDDLSHKLWKLLLGRTYLIVMDDIWDIGAWKDVRNALPDQGNGSRILFTSRVNDVALRSMSSFVPCSLTLLSDKESLELLEKMLFHDEGFPINFREVGQEIAVHCRGLPLAIVVISGVLATEMNLDWWKQVARNLKSIVVKDLTNFTNIIDLSFRYLPDYLKPCFLYFGAFQEDEKVNVSNLILLWTAEGLIQKSADKSSSDVAKDYIMELISRNLIIVAERSSMDGIKACRVHDLLHEICRTKAEEFNFLKVVNHLDESGSDLCPNPVLEYQCRRLCIYSTPDKFIVSEPSGRHVRSLLYFPPIDEFLTYKVYHPSFISSNFKLLSTLNLDRISIGDYLPNGIELLVHLRYLAFRVGMTVIPDSIAKLCFLETFLVKGTKGEILLPYNVWNMKTLTHLHVKHRVSFGFREEIAGNLSQLDNIETLSSVFLPYGESSRNILLRLLRIKKLKCIFSEYWDNADQCNKFPVLESLVQLESLKVLYHGNVKHPSVFSFPANIKKLTLSKFRLPWKDISAIGRLRCLEVLKLLFKAFDGEEWEVGNEEFLNLKYLKLESLDIARWIGSYDSFPCLEQIVLQSCKKLEEVPFAFGESPTLKMILVKRCSESAVKSVRDIQVEQFETLTRKLNVLVHPPDSYIPPF